MVSAVGVAQSFLSLAAAAENVMSEPKKENKRCCWVKPWIKRRATHATLVEVKIGSFLSVHVMRSVHSLRK